MCHALYIPTVLWISMNYCGFLWILWIPIYGFCTIVRNAVTVCAESRSEQSVAATSAFVNVVSGRLRPRRSVSSFVYEMYIEEGLKWWHPGIYV
jgi:hypothetical protein